MHESFMLLVQSENPTFILATFLQNILNILLFHRQHTIKGQLPSLNNDNAAVRACCTLSPCIETTFQPLGS